ncbi:VOC family protein [Phytoactinopolyspora halotolerans]|uniref:VOC family protein n=1 Tax=Phytoactinopolyspora halotolerans TaxID=1981512 RepID=A0A6L9SH99_9ACTN|nr:VOC family protein [Phytoactinopolyspora halotolerans]NEE04008.1 VOC family protein [Phytoactinopolyspora halotolerans]
MARLRDVVIDCAKPAPLARFWAAALDGYRVAPYDDEELARLRGLGIDDPEDDPSVLVEPVTGAGPRLWCTRVPEPKRGKNRVHLDIVADDPDDERTRLVGLGATVLRQDADGWTVLADPEGNEFCLEA